MFLICLIVLKSEGQKLPDLQTISLKAPKQVKADGKNLEWQDQFQAYNKRTDLYYTLSNDTENLYLVVKSTDPANSNKILNGGISFTINKEGKKRNSSGPEVTYPLARRGGMRQSGRKLHLAQVKEIKIKNFAGITDTLISIYNLHRIKAFAAVDTSGLFFYELAVPLKLIDLQVESTFAYNIKINGLQLGSFAGSRGGGAVSGVAIEGGPARGRRQGNNRVADFQSMMSPTDFWGTYKLAK